ncbi:MAG: group I truncated hemoglobin [Tepidiformaceae bacterium]
MEDFKQTIHGRSGRRDLLKLAGGVAVFGGAFVVVGCGDSKSKATPTAAAPATATSGAAATSGAGATSGATSGAAATASLYTRLGGAPAIQAVIDDFLVNVGADTKINHFFAGVDLKRLDMLLVQFVEHATGGAEQYTGRDMKTTHAGMKITMDDFNALVADLVKSLDKFKVPAAEKNELLGLLAPLSTDIVTA